MTDLDGLPEYLRARGFGRVLGVRGWRKRKRPTGRWNPRGIVVHHTGGKPNGMSYAEGILTKGYKGLPGPLCQIALNRAGTVIFIANGRANHAGKTRKVGFMAAGDGNTQSLGIEAMNTGTEGWTDVQYDAYVRLCAAICDYFGWPRSHVLGHGETSVTGKWDPGHRVNGRNQMIDMAKFRADVKAVKFEQDKLAKSAKPAPETATESARWLKVALVNHAASKGALAKVGNAARWLKRRRKLFDLVASINADVFAGLESGAGSTLAHIKKAYTNRGYKLGHEIKGRGIWVKSEVVVKHRGHFDPPQDNKGTKFWKPAPWIIAEFDGTDALIVASHIDPYGTNDLRERQQRHIVKQAEKVAEQHKLGLSQIVFLADMASNVLVRERVFNALGYGDSLETAAKIVNAEYKSFNQFKAPVKGPRVDGIFVRESKETKGKDANRPVEVASQRLTDLTDHHIQAAVINRQQPKE